MALVDWSMFRHFKKFSVHKKNCLFLYLDQIKKFILEKTTFKSIKIQQTLFINFQELKV